MKTKQHMNCNLKIDTLVEDFKGDKIQLLPNSKYVLIIDYPLEKMYMPIIITGNKGMDYTSLLKRIGKEYRYLYDNESKFGVWGHYLGDLYLEQIHVDHEAKKITLAIGS